MTLSEAQKRAHKDYNQKIKAEGKRKNVTISLSAEEAEKHREIMKEHGVTPIQVWRKGIDTVSKEPTDKG